MPKRYIKQYIPDHDKLCEHKHLRFLGPILRDPNLLHLNKRSVSGAVSLGLFLAFIPVPFQMLLAAISAIFIRVNLPISVGVVWISNPLTMPPLFYFAYKVGAWILGIPALDIQFELSFNWLIQSLDAVWEPFLLGCLIVGTISAFIGGLTVRALWRIHVVKLWKNRRLSRKLAKRQQNSVD